MFFCFESVAFRRYTPDEPRLWNLNLWGGFHVVTEGGADDWDSPSSTFFCSLCRQPSSFTEAPQWDLPSRWRWVLQMQRKVQWELRMCPLSELNVSCSPVPQVENHLRSSKTLLGLPTAVFRAGAATPGISTPSPAATKQPVVAVKLITSYRFMF